MRAIGYVRVSTIEQAESRGGLDAQVEAIKRGVATRGWELVSIQEDAAVSGALEWSQRPGLRDAINGLETGQADALVVHANS